MVRSLGRDPFRAEIGSCESYKAAKAAALGPGRRSSL